MTVDPMPQGYVYDLPDPFHPRVLLDQFIDAGLTPDPGAAAVNAGGYGPFVRNEDVLIVFVDQQYTDEVQAVLDAHPALAQAEFTKEQTAVQNAKTIDEQAIQALDANKADAATNDANIVTNDAYLAITSPTNAQVVAQVRELTRQANQMARQSTRQGKQLSGLIRKLFNRFEEVE